ncbi:hypothetical protein TWF506_001803 [Arthrobotrys conoides]|uniref:Gfd2/YDR514C-like C-terminal domain-containing protein n=1 Tax=Arthrobotrys conoides TaxID=74498 RepID=A0AAN8P3D5_9PEZI
MVDTNTNIKHNSVQALQGVLRLTPPSQSPLYEDVKDAVFVAIDCENASEFMKCNSLENANSQIGLAILDTRDLPGPDSSIVNISTYNFATGTSKYGKRVSTRFLFGKSYNLCTQKEQLAEQIKNIIPESRNIILVGHAIRQDLMALSSLDAGFLEYRFFDTQTIARSVLPVINKNMKANESLHNLLKYFNCPFDRLHCAGNDANFTLRLLLLLAIYPLKKVTLQPDQEEIVKNLKNIAYNPLPAPKPYPHDIALARKQGRRQRKLRARFQDSDTIARVRAERARKKEGKLVARIPEMWEILEAASALGDFLPLR